MHVPEVPNVYRVRVSGRVGANVPIWHEVKVLKKAAGSLRSYGREVVLPRSFSQPRLYLSELSIYCTEDGEAGYSDAMQKEIAKVLPIATRVVRPCQLFAI